MNDKRTTDSVLEKLKELVETKAQVSPEQWIDAALYLEILKLDEQDILLALEMSASRKLLETKEKDMSVAEAKMIWKATHEYEVWQQQKRKLDEIQEFVRIAKKQAEIRRI